MLLPILILILFGIFLIKGLRKYSKGSIEESMAYIYSSIGLKIVSGSFLNYEIAIKTIEKEISVFSLSKPNVLQFGTGVVLIIIGVWFFGYIKNRLFILNIKGKSPYYAKSIENHYENLKIGWFGFKEREIDLIYPKEGLDNKKANELIEFIKFKVDVFKNISKGAKLGFTGIAEIPFVAYTGTLFKREPFSDFFEFDKKESGKYYILNSQKKYPKLEQKTCLKSKKFISEEIVISVSISKKISDKQLKQFPFETIHLSVGSPSLNKITSKIQLFDYRDVIISLIEQLTERCSDLKKIHMVLATQTCLAFEIGRNVEDSSHPQLICYHFDAQGEKKYPWGLVLNGPEEGKLIKG